jgi:UDP-N-acetylglucosamine 4,6-dehydratase/5-epimerase
LKVLNGKSILVTGGTGSFGNAFIKKILNDYQNIEKIVIFSRDEYKQFLMANKPEFKDIDKLRFFIGDVRDRDRLYRAFDGIDIVVHAAALKQVPSCEYNPFEAVKTNVLGAQNVIDAAIDRNVKKVIALSTDKACAPINLYGATKLCSDKLFIASNVYSGLHQTKFSVVRYGNVAGSRGSIIPYFQKLVRGGAVELPITDIRMTRFWLELDQAVKMVLQAFEVMGGGELFVKKIPSIKIVDLAKVIAPQLPLKIVGIRPGEKIHEVMITQEDARYTLEFRNFFIVYPEFKTWRGKQRFLGARRLCGDAVPKEFEYHSGKNKKWLTVQQMKQMVDNV